MVTASLSRSSARRFAADGDFAQAETVFCRKGANYDRRHPQLRYSSTTLGDVRSLHAIYV
jgi:hypothetical protein